MSQITTALIFVWMINILAFMGQAAMIDMNPDSITFFNTSGTVIEGCFATSGGLMPNSSSIANDLNPLSAESAEDSGSILPFIDSISTIKNWVLGKLKCFVSVVMSPYNFLSSIPAIPRSLVNVIGLFWAALNIFIFVAFIIGRAI